MSIVTELTDSLVKLQGSVDSSNANQFEEELLTAVSGQTMTLDAEELARVFFISKYHMMRQFHKETGNSIHSYLSTRRLMYARELISHGTPATDACFASGFRSYSSFTRAYSKHFGTTPTGRIGLAKAQTEELE